MKRLLNITLTCVLLALLVGCAKRSTLDHPLDVGVLYGLSEREIQKKLGKPSDTAITKDGTVYFWEVGDTSLGAIYTPNGKFRSFSLSVYDFGKGNVYSYEKLRAKFNIDPNDSRYQVHYSLPEKDTGSVTTAHIRPR